MISKFFFAGDKLMPQMHLRQPRLEKKMLQHILKENLLLLKDLLEP